MEGDLEFLEELSSTVVEASLCQLGGSAPNPVLSTLRYFRHEYEEHIRDHKCRAGVCKTLIEYTVFEENCEMCGVCRKHCPVGAIEGEKKKMHFIDPAKCIKCGICFEVCNFDAIEVK
jgi:ferredoxin